MSARHTLAALLGLLLPALAAAHSGSNAYLHLQSEGAALSLRADYALADLDDAIGIDADDDGQLTWAEVQAATPAISAYLVPRLAVRRGGEPCPLTARPGAAIADRSDGPYLVLRLEGQCARDAGASQLEVGALFEFDASHRVFARWQQGADETSAVLAPERASLAFGSNDASDTGTLGNYWREGLAHVWSGWDHLLFIAGLFLAAALVREGGRWQPAARLGPALLDAAKLVTAFTLAHAVTLCLTALGLLSLPTRLVESLVALSVAFAGLNNLWPLAGRRKLFALAWVFGLIHGTAIAGALLELGLPTQGRLLALFGFNLGVEAAQLLLVAVLVPLAFALRHWRGYVPLVLWPGSALVVVAGLVWFIDRAFALGWPLPI